jgi:hypothetical protein
MFRIAKNKKIKRKIEVQKSGIKKLWYRQLILVYLYGD